MHPALLIQHLNKLLPQGEVLGAQEEHPQYIFGKVITHCTRVINMSDKPGFRQTLFVSYIPNIVLP